MRGRYLVDAKGLNKIKGQPFTIQEIVGGVRAILEGRVGKFEVISQTDNVMPADAADVSSGGD